MGGQRIRVELFITCERHGCSQIKRVKNRTVQKVQRFCSRRCATLACNGNEFHREAQSRGGKMRAHRARLAVMEHVKNQTPIEAFRHGYKLGLESKWRQTKRRKVAA